MTNEPINSYYYTQGRRVNVFFRRDLIAVAFRPGTSEQEKRTLERSLEASIIPSNEFPEIQSSDLRIYRTQNGAPLDRSTTIATIRSHDNVEKGGEVYVSEHGRAMVLTNEIVCKFKPEVTANQIEHLKHTYSLETVEALPFSPNTYVFKVQPDDNALVIANQLVEQGHALYAYPNWIEQIGYRHLITTAENRNSLRTTDPMFEQQWHLRNVGQLAGGVGGTSQADTHATFARQTTMGSPAIKLAIIDGGIDIAHKDLNVPGKIVDPIDLMTTPPDTNPLGTSHGTQVAGMAVAAANNGVGGTGIAPNCTLIPIKANDITSQLLLARAFVYAADKGADVITSSLGPVGQWIMTDALKDAIDYATTFGRKGKGCVYTQAVDNQPNSISLDQVSAYERSISVSRTNNRDKYDGAATGPELDLCAPGVDVLTITNTTADDLSTVATVTGTSFATPLTAGVACLVLTVNPNLSWQEVRQILLDSADKIDAETNPYAAAPPGRPRGTRNDRYGYGRINAQRAVELAQEGSKCDLYIKNINDDDGSTTTENWGFWDSPSIWVRTVDDNGTVHQVPKPGQDNFIYVRVHNRGNEESLPSWVRFYITTYAGTEFHYPYDYIMKFDSNTLGYSRPGNLKAYTDFPDKGTYFLGEQRHESIPSGGELITKLRWDKSLISTDVAVQTCLLVEVSPHDGPSNEGLYLWQRNNLAQKNYLSVDVSRDRWFEIPFRFGHEELKEPFIELEFRKINIPDHWSVALDLKDPELLAAIASANSATVSQNAVTPVLSNSNPWRLTLLKEAQVSISYDREAHGFNQSLVLTFPAGTSADIVPLLLNTIRENQKRIDVNDRSTLRDTSHDNYDFNITLLNGKKMIEINPSVSGAKLKVPLKEASRIESSLMVRISDGIPLGGNHSVHVAQLNAEGRLVGGIHINLNPVT